MEADGNAHLAWKILLNKFEVSEQKQESLTDVTMEWAACKLLSTKMDPDNWFSELYHINQKFRKIKPEYEKDEDSIKAHVISNLPEEYKAVCTSLYMAESYTYNDYKRYVRHFWYSELGGKEMIANGTDVTYKAAGSNSTGEQEQALNTSTAVVLSADAVSAVR